MINQDYSPFEEKMHQATRLPLPDPQFDDVLWTRIVELDYQTSINSEEPRKGFLIELHAFLNGNQPRFRRLRTGMAFILALALAAFLLFSTPAGRTLAQSIIHFFTPQISDVLPVPTEKPLVWAEQTPGKPVPTQTELPKAGNFPECGNFPKPLCSVEQIRSKVDFPVKQLASAPAPMIFIGATGEPGTVWILYDTPDHSGAILMTIQPWSGGSEKLSRNIGATAVVDAVKIGDFSGEYVKGAFGYQSGETEAHWDNNADTQTLRWVDAGVLYTLLTSGQHLNKDELISLAGNLTDKPANQPDTPTPGPDAVEPEVYDFRKDYPLTLAEAEKLAGYKVLQPSSLPEILSFLGAAYKPEEKMVRTSFMRSQDIGQTTDGLLLSEQPIPESGAYPLSSFIVGTKTEVDKYAPGIIVGTVERIQVGGVMTQYVEGNWQGTDCCGWKWSPDPYLKRLRWQTKDMAFELSYVGLEITKEDILKIAESLK
jgi:hypothetical protein